MKNFTKILCLLLAVVFCAGAFAACNNDSDNTSSGTSNVVPGGGETEYTYGPADYGEFPYADKNFEGSDPVKILCVNTARHKYGEQQFTYIEDNEGNTINTAVQKRNEFLRDTYGITFEITSAQYPGDELKLLIDTGTYEYDLICESVDRLVTGITSKYYWSLDDIMNINHPWWDAEAIDALAIGEKHFLLAGAGLLTDDDNTYLTLFNKDMYNTNTALAAKGDIYDIVREGKFTIDLYYEMCKEVSQPDSAGAWSFDATYGNLSHSYGATVMMNGCDIATVAKNENDELYINVMESQAVKAFDKVYALMSDLQNTQRAELIIGQGSNPSTYGFAELEEMFRNGRGLFYNTTSTSVSILKSANLDFELGVLPIPKYDENQAKYCNTVNRYHSSALAIPSNVSADKLDHICFALQALSFYNADVIRAYYQNTLQLQAVQSDDDAEMLDIVYNNRFYDIGAIYGWSGLINLYGNVIQNAGGNTLASSWESMANLVKLAMEKEVKAYNEALN